jgi:hypothetical protein
MILDEFSKKVLNKFSDNITDRVFLMIQKDEELMQEYRALLKRGKDQHAINSHLGKKIRMVFNLYNAGRCNDPESTLIQSYERHVTNM